jgi:hypothetical protein
MSFDFYLGCIGCLFILKYGSILKPIRDFLCKKEILMKLFKCSLCLGFWVGLFWSILYDKTLITPFAVSALCWIVDTALQYLQTLDQIALQEYEKRKGFKS